MKRYTLSFADAMKHEPKNPDRTARRSADWDITFQVWPSRASMARSIRMQERAAPRAGNWKACIELSPVEGY